MAADADECAKGLVGGNSGVFWRAHLRCALNTIVIVCNKVDFGEMDTEIRERCERSASFHVHSETFKYDCEGMVSVRLKDLVHSTETTRCR